MSPRPSVAALTFEWKLYRRVRAGGHRVGNPALLCLRLDPLERTIAIDKKKEQTVATAAAAVMAKARRDVVDHFMANNAVSSESAVGYEPSRRMQRRMIERMQRDGVLVAAGHGRWFIDIPRYRAGVNSRRKRVLGAVGLVILTVAGAALLG